jgi:hypothetical protein
VVSVDTPGQRRARTLDDAHGHAAVDDEILSGNKVILYQRGDQGRDILRLTFFVKRDAIPDIVRSLFRGK